MLAKVFARGRGGGRGPVEYLIGNDQQRPDATVLRGEPEQIRELINQCPYSRKYTSAVLSFAESEISDALRWQCINEFEQTLMPGLDFDQYDTLWVEHYDKGRVELHCVIANTELLSGKRLQPFYADADLGRVNQWKEAINAEWDLADPSDPRRRQAVTLPSNLPRDRKEALERIRSTIREMAETGYVQNRDDVINALTHAGIEVSRKTKSSISIRHKKSNKNIRLTGTVFERDFTPEKLKSTDAGAAYDAQRLERAKDARQRWHSMIERKAAYNKHRYQRPPTPKPRIRHGTTKSNRATVNRHSQGTGITFNRDVLRAKRAVRQARRDIRLSTALDCAQRIRHRLERLGGRTAADSKQALQPLLPRRTRLGTATRPTAQNAVMSDMRQRVLDGRGRQTLLKLSQQAAFNTQPVYHMRGTQNMHESGERSESGMHDVSTRRMERRATGAAFGTAGLSDLLPGFQPIKPGFNPSDKSQTPDKPGPSDPEPDPDESGPEPDDSDENEMNM